MKSSQKKTVFVQFRATIRELNWLRAQASLYSGGNMSALIWQRLYSGDRMMLNLPQTKNTRERKPKQLPQKERRSIQSTTT